MRLNGRSLVGLASGLLRGAGAAVLINISGLSTLSPLLVIAETLRVTGQRHREPYETAVRKVSRKTHIDQPPP